MLHVRNFQTICFYLFISVLSVRSILGRIRSNQAKMPHVKTWDDFAKHAEMLYVNDPIKSRFVIKYRHCDGALTVKITDDRSCYLYTTEHAQDIKKLEKLTSQLMRHMASKESK